MANFYIDDSDVYEVQAYIKNLSTVNYNRVIEFTLDGEVLPQFRFILPGGVTPDSEYRVFISNLGHITEENGVIWTIGCGVYRWLDSQEPDYSTTGKLFYQEIEHEIPYNSDAYCSMEMEYYNSTSESGISFLSPTVSPTYAPDRTSFYFYAHTNPGYIFAGWYDADGEYWTRCNPKHRTLRERNSPEYYEARAKTCKIEINGERNATTIIYDTTFMVNASASLSHDGNLDDDIIYYLNVYDQTDKSFLYEQYELTYDEFIDGFDVEDLEVGHKYSVNLGVFTPQEDEIRANVIQWIAQSNSSYEPPIVEVKGSPVTITTRTYVQSADGTYSNYYNYSFDYSTGDIVDIEDWADDIYNNYLSDDLTDKLLANIQFAYMKKTSSGSQITSGDYTVGSSNTTVYFYFSRVSYVVTLDADTGINNFTVNTDYTYNVGNQLSYFYEQSVKIQANILNNYNFIKWTANPTTITAVHEKTNNPLTFTMPASDFTIKANIDKAITKYNVKINCYYELADMVGYEGGYEETLTINEGTYLDFDDYYEEYLLTGFNYLEGTDEDGDVVSGITVTGNTTIAFYYTRKRYNLTLKNTDGGINYFEVNGSYKNVGSVLEYKYGQSVTIEAVCKGKYTFKSWSSSYYTGLSGNPTTITIPNQSTEITAITEQSVSIDEWEWTDDELDAFANKGPFNTLTADRWNEFLDWCNEVIEYTGGTTISSDYYGTEDEPLYASDFNIITKRLGNVASGIATEVKATKEPGDIVYGWYFTNLSEAMNDLL